MRTFLKILTALLLLMIMVVAVILFLPDQQYKQIAGKLIEYATDREVTIGELTTIRSLNPVLEIKGFKLSNANWAEPEHMISAGNVFLSLDFVELLGGKLHINKLSADDLIIDLRKNENGEANWQFKEKQPEAGKKFDRQLLTRFTLSEFNLSESQLSYVDEQKKLTYHLELPGFQLAKNKQNPDSQQVNVQGVFNDLPFTVNGNAGLIDAIVKNKSLPFDLKSQLNESDLAINGQLVEQPDGLYLSTSVTAHTSSLTDLSAFTVNELPPIGPITISAEIAGNLKAITAQGIDVNNLKVTVDDPAIKLDIHGSLSSLGAENTGEVLIDLDVFDLTKLAQLVGLKKELPGRLSLTASASGSGENFGLTISEATLDSEFIGARVSGQISDLFNSRKADIKVDANAPNLDFVTQLFGRKMPPEWGPVYASATLSGKNGQYALTDISAELKGASTLSATGSIGSLVKFDNMELDVEASLATLSEISAFTPRPLPDLGPMTGDGKIIWREGKLALIEAKANYNGEYGNADVTGSIGDLVKFDIVRLKADATIPDLGVFELFSGVKLPDLKEVTASADLVSPTARDLSARNLTASYDMDGAKINARGSIDSMVKKRADFNIDLEADLDSLAPVNSLFKSSLPEFGPITAKGKVRGAKKDIQLNEVDILLSDSTLYGSLKGDLGKLFEFKGVDFDVDLSTPAVDQLFSRLNLQTKINKPANLVSHVNYEAGTFKFEKSELDLRGDKIIGRLTLFNYLDKDLRPKISGKFNVLNFNLRDFSSSDPDTPDQEQNLKFLSRKPLPYEFIENTDLDLEINIGRLRSTIFDFTNSTLVVRSTDGRFKLGPFKGKLSDGDASFQLDIDAKSRPTRTKLIANIEGFNMAKAGVFRDSRQLESRGAAVLKLNLDTKGRTPASIMANANGGGALYVEDLLLKPGAVNLFTSSLIKTVINAVNPFKKKPKDTKINCAALAFKINDGLMITPFGLAAEATEYSVTGNGSIDFKTEAVDLEFNTKVKKLLAINPLEKLTGLVKVAGELTAPVVTFNPRGIFNVGATVGAALATGGLSFWAQDQLEKLNAKTELCAKALGKGTSRVSRQPDQ